MLRLVLLVLYLAASFSTSAHTDAGGNNDPLGLTSPQSDAGGHWDPLGLTTPHTDAGGYWDPLG